MIPFTFGSDPEFVIFDAATKLPASAIRLVPHGKSNKIKISEDQYMFYDNVLLEFNVKAASTFAQFRRNLARCLFFAKKYLDSKGAYLVGQASTVFPKTECENPEASVFGCDPEFNIYRRTSTGLIMRVEPPVVTSTLRTCGGHIHIGHPVATIDPDKGGNAPLVVKLMDAFVGSTALLLDKDPSSQARRQIYGGAGTHRVASYGLEYRTLSNFWLNSPDMVNAMFQLTRQVVELAMSKPEVIDDVISPTELENIINTGNISEARSLFDQIKHNLSWELQNLIEAISRSEFHNWSVYWAEEPILKKVNAVAG